MQALEAACAVIDRETAGLTELALMAAKARGLIVGYDLQWRNQEYTAIAVENVVTAELFNPKTGARSRTFTLAGKLDVCAELNGRYGIIDHKTTSDDIADPNATYWRQLVVEGQLSHYMLLEWLNGRKPEFAVWDVIRKPDIRPRELKRAEKEDIARKRLYFGQLINDETAEEALRWGRETYRLYEIRLAYDCSVERPERYFQRRSIPRLDSEILEYAGELWDHSQDIILARRLGRMPRNSGACMTYGSPCMFLGVCSGHDEIESERWQNREWVHPELPILNGNGAEILTNSRIRTWQTCRRKHLLQYDVGKERAEAEDSEARIFGDLIHKALAAWWGCFISKQENEYGNTNNVAAGAAAIV